MRLIKVVFLSILCFHFGSSLFAQNLYGKIYDENGNLIPFASVTVKGTTTGVNANNNGEYAFHIKPGKYVVVCRHIGYEAVEKMVEVENDLNLDFVLSVQYLNLKELVIDNKAENPAYAIIRQAIKKRNLYNDQVKAFQCGLYSKDLVKLRNLPKKIMGQKMPEEDKRAMKLDSSGKGIIYLSESISKVYKSQPDKFKLEVMSSRVSGSNGFGFTFPAFINMYTNNVSVFDGSLNKRGFVSPIADGALRYYRFKMMGTFEENGKTINTIKVIPKRKYEPLFSGIINITDEDWRIHSFDLMVTKENQLEILDTLKISQLYLPADEDIWTVKNQLMYFNFKMLGIDIVGNSLSVYSDYIINPVFDKKIFDRILIKYDTAVNKKSRAYWDTIRPVPLEPEELNDYRLKDSLFQIELREDSLKNNIDSLKKKQGKLKLISVVFPGINRVHYSKKENSKWGIAPLLNNIQFNTAEGAVVQLLPYYQRKIHHKKTILKMEPGFRYGFDNEHFNGWVTMTLSQKNDAVLNSNNRIWNFSGGSRVSQYDKGIPIQPITNTFTTLGSGDNFMKTYENKYANIAYTKTYDNGFRFCIQGLYEDRKPLFNVTNHTFKKEDTVNLTENYPTKAVTVNDIIPHQTVIASAKVVFRPGQKFIQLPNGKIPLSSIYPTFSLTYTKGIKKIAGSDVDFDKWKLLIVGDRNLKLFGLIKYRLGAGGFLNNNKVFIQDYTHFNANGLTSATDYVQSFQLMSSYEHSNKSDFYVSVNLEHHFNGLLTNKIPLLKKWNWNLVAGTNGFFINDNNNFIEGFVGLENIFKICRIDYVSALDNGKTRRNAVVIGFDGLIGSALSTSFQSESQDFSDRIGF